MAEVNPAFEVKEVTPLEWGGREAPVSEFVTEGLSSRSLVVDIVYNHHIIRSNN